MIGVNAFGIGVNSEQLEVAFVIPSFVVIGFLDRYKKTMTTKVAEHLCSLLGMTVTPLPPTRTSLIVVDVQPESRASKSGVKSHDLIVAFNGQKVSNYRDTSSITELEVRRRTPTSKYQSLTLKLVDIDDD